MDCYFPCACKVLRYGKTRSTLFFFLLSVIRGRIHRYILAAFSLPRDRKQLHTRH